MKILFPSGVRTMLLAIFTAILVFYNVPNANGQSCPTNILPTTCSWTSTSLSGFFIYGSPAVSCYYTVYFCHRCCGNGPVEYYISSINFNSACAGNFDWSSSSTYQALIDQLNTNVRQYVVDLHVQDSCLSIPQCENDCEPSVELVTRYLASCWRWMDLSATSGTIVLEPCSEWVCITHYKVCYYQFGFPNAICFKKSTDSSPGSGECASFVTPEFGVCMYLCPVID